MVLGGAGVVVVVVLVVVGVVVVVVLVVVDVVLVVVVDGADVVRVVAGEVVVDVVGGAVSSASSLQAPASIAARRRTAVNRIGQWSHAPRARRVMCG